ncbi:MAG: SNF2-related protein [Parcubacteria group bacterium GW2011_GWF2_50_9]|nr:MAG: SNF2-related protein [Parcubacteria group bacterium GW2011_GWF2_50_9]
MSPVERIRATTNLKIIDALNHPDISVSCSMQTITNKYPAPKVVIKFVENENYGRIEYTLIFKYGYDSFDNAAPKKENMHIDYSIPDNPVIVWRNTDYENEIENYCRDLFIKNGASKAWGYTPKYVFERQSIYNILLKLGEKLISDGFEICIKDEFNNVKLGGKIKFSISAEIDWFDISAIYAADDGTEIKLKIDRKLLDSQFVKAGSSLIYISKENADKLKELLGQGMTDDGEIKVSKYNFHVIDQLYDEFRDSENGRFTDAKNLGEKLRNFKTIEKLEIPKNFVGVLRDYQHAGFNWLGFLHRFSVNGCLADDMGLGKTVQTLAFLQFLKEKKELNLSLLIVPVSTIGNWDNEIKKFTPKLKSAIHHGAARTDSLDMYKKTDIIIISYHTLRNDIEFFLEHSFDYVILDEAQNIKNVNSLVFKSVRMLLTGTPIENNTLELWAQFDYLLPGLLGSQSFFKSFFSRPIETFKDKKVTERLRNTIFPFILRRKKEEVLKELPEKTEIILQSEMGSEQKKLYEKHRDTFRAMILKKIDEDGINKSAIHIFSALLRLRQLALFPALIDDKFKKIESCKFEQLKETIDEILAEDHKILFFSQFVEVLKIIRESYIEKKNIKYSYIDGSTGMLERKKGIEAFQTDKDIKVFLLSLKTGAFGINLTAADYVIIFDPWWNPAVESQAVDRAHRIGQTSKVIAYKLIVKDTVEEKILELQNKKKELVRELITSEASFFKTLTKNDIAKLFE